MSTVWVGFLGVLVGSAITVAWNWLAVIRKEQTDAVVAARLVDENLAALAHAIRVSPGEEVSPQIGRQIWENNRSALAAVLGEQQWREVSAVYRHRDPQAPPDRFQENIGNARYALGELVEGRRHVLPYRWRNRRLGRRSLRRAIGSTKPT